VYGSLGRENEKIHSYKIRRSNKASYFLPRISKSAAGQNKLNYKATKLWNVIDEILKRRHFKKKN